MRRLISQILLLAMMMLLAACSFGSKEYALDGTPPEQKIVINKMAKWRVAPARTGAAYTPAHEVENWVDKIVFRVNQTGKRNAWELPLGHVIDVNQYPILTLKYRSNSPSRFDVWSLWANNLAYRDSLVNGDIQR